MTAPKLIRNKLIKLIVDIARTDWPHFYPNFFTNIHELIMENGAAGPKTNLGLTMLLITSEELATQREDLSMSRKDELKRLLLSQVPNTLNILCTLLTMIHREKLSSPNSGATNSTGFEGLPGGERFGTVSSGDFQFSSLTFSGFFWSSTASGNGTSSWGWALFHFSPALGLSSTINSKSGRSLRCIQD